MSEEIIWEDPPPKNTNAARCAERHKALAENPGRWLVWHTSTNDIAALQLAASLKKAHGYEVTCRGPKVYARKVLP